MYIGDRDTLKYVSRFVLILLPVVSSLSNSWSWAAEILLFFAVFFHGRDSSLRLTSVLLGAGYVAALIVSIIGVDNFWLLGFSPWAGVLLLALERRGMTTGQSMFWSLIAVVFLSSLPVIPMLREALRPENIQEAIARYAQAAEQQGWFAVLEKQNLTEEDFKSYLGVAIPVYYKLTPAMAGIFGMAEMGLAYLVYRQSIKARLKLPSFAVWQLPWYTIWIAIAGIAIYLSGNHFKVYVLETVGMNLILVMAAISLLLGCCCLVFLLTHSRMPRWFFWLIIFGVIFLNYYIVMGLVFIGLFDLAFNIRKIPEKTEEGKL